MRSNRTGYAKYLRANATLPEEAVWKVLRSMKDIRFRRQSAMGPYVMDFYSPRFKLCVELDGPLHDAEADKLRDAWFLERGVETLRFCTETLSNDAIAQAVAAFCAQRKSRF